MAQMPRPRPPFLQHEPTRHGKMVWYVRKGKGARIRIRAEFGTPEFEEAYQAAITGAARPTRRKASAGSLQWLWDRYRETIVWTGLSVATRRQRENIMLHVLKASGHEPYADVTRKDILDGCDRRKETPAQVRNFLDALRGLFRWAVAAGLACDDPTAGVRNPARKKTEGFKAWTLEDDVARYEARWAPGTKERVWMHVLLYIGCRRGDAVLLGKQHVRNGALTFITEKGREKVRIEVTRRLEPELVATLARGPCGDLSFICGERGNPLTKESFGNDFKVACVAAGIMDKSAHGLRKLSATIWAERGASEHELMAMFGWLTPAMAALYTRAVARKRLALNAYDRIMGT